MNFQPIKESPKYEPVDISEYVDQLDGNIKTCVLDLQSERCVCGGKATTNNLGILSFVVGM